MCKRGFTAMADKPETSSPATLALAKATFTAKKASPFQATWAAQDTLHSMISMRQMEFGAFPEEESCAFPSLEWNLDEDTISPVDALSSALSILRESEEASAFRSSNKPQAKRRRMGDHSGMVRSKAMKSSLSALVSNSNSCSKESSMPFPKFALADWGNMVTARSVTSDLASCSLKTSSPFADTVNSSLLTV